MNTKALYLIWKLIAAGVLLLFLFMCYISYPGFIEARQRVDVRRQLVEIREIVKQHFQDSPDDQNLGSLCIPLDSNSAKDGVVTVVKKVADNGGHSNLMEKPAWLLAIHPLPKLRISTISFTTPQTERFPRV